MQSHLISPTMHHLRINFRCDLLPVGKDRTDGWIVNLASKSNHVRNSIASYRNTIKTHIRHLFPIGESNAIRRCENISGGRAANTITASNYVIRLWWKWELSNITQQVGLWGLSHIWPRRSGVCRPLNCTISSTIANNHTCCRRWPRGCYVIKTSFSCQGCWFGPCTSNHRGDK